MSDERRREWLRVRTGEAASGYAAARAEIERDVSRPPRPGDVFLFAETGALPVEWVVVEEDETAPRRLLVVPVDDHPLLGCEDVELNSEAAGGLTSVRCRLGVWLDAQVFDPRLRTGVLSAEVLDRVRRRRGEIEAGAVTATGREVDGEGDPEYRGWMEELDRAQALLPGSRGW